MTDILDLEGKEYEMTYEDWWLEFTSVHPDWRYADSEALRKAAFESGAASRDAEIAELVSALDAMHNDSDECMDFDECTGMFVPINEWNAAFEALAATEPK